MPGDYLAEESTADPVRQHVDRCQQIFTGRMHELCIITIANGMYFVDFVQLTVAQISSNKYISQSIYRLKDL